MSTAPEKTATAVRNAPGHPGVTPTWSSSSKIGVGTAINRGSRVWFTLAEGLISEVFFPQLDTPAIRDIQFMVSDGVDFFSDQRRDTACEIGTPMAGVPAYEMTNRCKRGRYRLEQEIIADPDRSVLLIRVRLVPISIETPRLHLLLAPHLCARGWGNRAWVSDFQGEPLLFAGSAGVDGPSVVAVGCSVPFTKRSVGYCGVSDGWQDVSKHCRMEWEYDAAPDGNVALTAELDTSKSLSFVIAVGFSTTEFGAGHHVLASLIDGFDDRHSRYVAHWQRYLGKLRLEEKDLPDEKSMAAVSAAVLRTHEAKEYPGGMVASLSTPWGEYRDDGETGYHMVWTRDLIESAGGLIAINAHGAARRVLTYLHTTQEADGHWPQNMYVDGRRHWTGIQMDEIGFPIHLAFTSVRNGTLGDGELSRYWPTVRKAADYIIRHGPATQMDRWEEFSGFSTFTLAVEISALRLAANYAERIGENGFAQAARATADEWDSKIEAWTYVTGTELARQVGVQGYYAFVVPQTPEDLPPMQRTVPVRHWMGKGSSVAGEIVSPDALALVRFGLRTASDPRILDTIRAIDATLRVETPYGPCWRRFNGDGYGESETGEPFRDGSNGIGRPWPLLVGERAHYELAAGNRDEAIRLMHVMESFANASGFFPEQIWDGPDLPHKALYSGRPTGSAMPLVWAHAEYLKLRRSIAENRVFDFPTGE